MDTSQRRLRQGRCDDGTWGAALPSNDQEDVSPEFDGDDFVTWVRGTRRLVVMSEVDSSRIQEEQVWYKTVVAYYMLYAHVYTHAYKYVWAHL